MQVHHRLHHIIRFLFFRVVNCFHSRRGRYGGGHSCTCSPPSGFVFSSLSDSFLLFRFLGPFPCSALCDVANNKTKRSVCLVERREPFLGFRIPGTCQSPSNHHRQTDRALGFFFGFGRATPFYGASPEPPPSTRTDNHAVGFHLGTHSSIRLKEELERKRRREKGKKKKLKIHDRHSTFGDCSKQEQQQRSSNHRIILLRVTRPSEQDASLNAVHSITIETNSSPANPFLPYDRSSASHQ